MLDPVDLVRTLLRFDTTNPPGNERECLDYVARVLRDHGLEPQFLARDPARPNLVVRLRGRGSAPPLLFHGHVDVVPADPAEWTRPPFAGDLVGDEVWGRGALDMKSGVAMLVAAVLRCHEEGFEPGGDVVLALLSDEEAGSEYGAKYLVDERRELFAGIRFAIGEFGGYTQWAGGRRLYPIQVAEKQACTIRATIRGAGGHAATVVRGTAAAKLGRLLVALDRKRLPVHVTPVLRTMLDGIAAGVSRRDRVALRALALPVLTDRMLGLLGESGQPLAPLLHNTATATVVHGGVKTNVVPTQITVELDGRVLPGQTPEDLVSELEALAPGLAAYEIVRAEPAVTGDPDLTLFPLLAEIIREREPDAVPFPMLLPGYTDARHFARLGIQTYGFLPLRLPPHITTALIHAPDERVPTDALHFGTDCLYELIRRYGPP